MGKQIVRVKRCSWDVMFYDDIMTGNGFIISEPAEVKIDREKKKSLYGPQSPLYGTTYEDDKHLSNVIVVIVVNLRENSLKAKPAPSVEQKFPLKEIILR